MKWYETGGYKSGECWWDVIRETREAQNPKIPTMSTTIDLLAIQSVELRTPVGPDERSNRVRELRTKSLFHSFY